MLPRLFKPSLGAAALPLAFASAAAVVLLVPNEVQQPGTQPGEGPNLGSVSSCDNCHAGYDPAVEPATNWRGGMMSQAGRDPLFWATVAVAESDFPGAGDLCLRCHAPRGWLEHRSDPTDGSILASSDDQGVECAVCHKLVNPDDSEWVGVQNSPFLAHDEGTPKIGYYGSGMMVLWGGRERLGPYTPTAARHPYGQSQYHRSSDLCGTCHDVSNPVVGDLAHNNGAQTALPTGTFSGQLGTPVNGKAAFNNFPFAYGVVERTFSEHKASLWPTTQVASFGSLPPELQDGAVAAAHAAATNAGGNGDYADGTTRFFTCQTCHLPAVTGRGAAQNNAPLRTDLPLHDMTGGNYWVPDAILWLDARNRLRLGGGMSADEISALNAGKQRARNQLDLAASLEVSGNTVRIINLTGHKLISGYPEGRRMWLRVEWRDATGNTLREDGEYGRITASINGTPTQVATILDLTNTRIYQAKPGITQEWATQLRGLGYPDTFPLEYDRTTGAVTYTLGDLIAQPPGTAHDSFRFVLNNTVVADNRIPAYGMSYDEAVRRNILPVPASQFGNPGAGGTYLHWDDVALAPPAGAVRAEIELLYQPTSWEYVQFLHLANDGSNAFLGNTGQDLLDAWLATGMAEPHTMATAHWCDLPGTGDDLTLESLVNNSGVATACAKTAAPGDQLLFTIRSPGGNLTGALAALLLEIYDPSNPPAPVFPGIQIGRITGQVTTFALPATGFPVSVLVPPGFGNAIARVQGVALSTAAANGTYAATDAHEIHFAQ